MFNIYKIFHVTWISFSNITGGKTEIKKKEKETAKEEARKRDRQRDRGWKNANEKIIKRTGSSSCCFYLRVYTVSSRYGVKYGQHATKKAKAKTGFNVKTRQQDTGTFMCMVWFPQTFPVPFRHYHRHIMLLEGHHSAVAGKSNLSSPLLIRARVRVRRRRQQWQ